MAVKSTTEKSKTKTAAVSATEAKRAAATAKQGVVGLAVGLAIGTAAGDTVKVLVRSFIDPIVQLLVGSQSGLQAATFGVNIAGREAQFGWGAFVSSLITLLAVAAVVYAFVHMLKLDRVDRKKG